MTKLPDSYVAYDADTQEAVFEAGIRWLVERYECTCHPAYADRGRRDPRCTRCDLERTIKQHDIDIPFSDDSE